jgi:hypothetical protein
MLDVIQEVGSAPVYLTLAMVGRGLLLLAGMYSGYLVFDDGIGVRGFRHERLPIGELAWGDRCRTFCVDCSR